MQRDGRDRAAAARSRPLQHRARHHPETVNKAIDEIRKGTLVADHKPEPEENPTPTYYSGPSQLPKVADPVVKYLTDDQKLDLVAQLTREMDAAAENLEFEKAAELRDPIAQIEATLAA